MKISRLTSAALVVVALPLLAPAARATNPCDISEEACKQWHKAMEAQQNWRFQRDYNDHRIPAEACDANPALCEPDAAGAPAKCPDSPELEGRAIQAAITFLDSGKIVILKLSPAGCDTEHPRVQSPIPDFSRRNYKAADGTSISVVTDAGQPRSTVSVRLPDGSASDLTLDVPTQELASGRAVDFGEVTLAKIGKTSQDDKTVRVKLTVRAVAP